MDMEDTTTAIDRKMLAALERQKKGTRSAWFVVIAGNQAGAMYKLEKEEALIGRYEDASIRIEDDGVSRRHALITRQPDGAVVIEDLKSTNGTYCNGKRIEARVLKDGDKIRVGTTTIIKFSLQDSLEEEFQRRQYELATRDSLTRCFNRKYFAERLITEFSFAERHDKPLSLAMIDIDHFKKINDTHGHVAGDGILRNLAGEIQKNIRDEDVLARYGGEEFALIMRETGLQNAVVAAERIRKITAGSAFPYEGEKLSVTVSIGVATWPDDDIDSPTTLIRMADENLYTAKRAGRNRVVWRRKPG